MCRRALPRLVFRGESIKASLLRGSGVRWLAGGMAGRDGRRPAGGGLFGVSV